MDEMLKEGPRRAMLHCQMNLGSNNRSVNEYLSQIQFSLSSRLLKLSWGVVARIWNAV